MSDVLDIVMGHDGEGRSFKIRSPEPLSSVERVKGNVLRGRLPSWRRVVVMAVAPGGARRAWVLEPGLGENAIEHAPFAVRGRFAVVAETSSPRAADRLWRDTAVL
ncbi:MAG: hypothetical protein KF850_33180 [Labilithrix sp.]|nr:hypothetical protein [Labilithrix sp.]